MAACSPLSSAYIYLTSHYPLSKTSHLPKIQPLNMPFTIMPNEILQTIADLLPSEKDISAFSQTNKHLHNRVGDYLYLRNLRQGCTAVYWAIQECMHQTAKRMLELGADVNAPYFDRPAIRTPLGVAIDRGQHELAKILLEFGPDVNGRGSFGQMPLFAAARNGNIVAVNLLLEFGADREVYDYDYDSPETPLYQALPGEHHSVAILLLEETMDKKVDPVRR